MSYSAYIIELKNVRPHENADRLQIAECLGDQVIVGLDAKEGDVGIYFPTDGQISHEFCLAHNLYSKSALQQLGLLDTGLYGFFDKNRRVRAQSFRGARSEGFWLPISSLNLSGITNVPYDTFPVGAAIDDGAICNKYLTPKTANKRTKNAQSRGSKGELKGFPKHYDTKQFRYEVDQIPVGSIVYITEKLHGTSHRVGSVRSENPTRWYRKLFSLSPRMGYQVEHGTRNVLLGHGTGAGYYASDQFRLNALAGIDAKMRKGEVVYGELVGFHDFAQPIMPSVNVPKDLPEIRQKYGEQITYTYGCHEIHCEFYAYRIVHFNEGDPWIRFSWL